MVERMKSYYGSRLREDKKRCPQNALGFEIFKQVFH
jgi:hypothetical protein